MYLVGYLEAPGGTANPGIVIPFDFYPGLDDGQGSMEFVTGPGGGGTRRVAVFTNGDGTVSLSVRTSANGVLDAGATAYLDGISWPLPT